MADEDSKNFSNDLSVVNTTSGTLETIDSEVKILKDKQVEIDRVIQLLAREILPKEDNNRPVDYRDTKRKKSASELMEQMRSYVELTKTSIDISKSAIKVAQDKQKITLDAIKLIDPDNSASGSGALTLDDILEYNENPKNFKDALNNLKKKKAKQKLED